MGEHAIGGGYSVDGEFELGPYLILEGMSAFE
jgi:hypothetical protein